jgi:toxin ParE1/3/4
MTRRVVARRRARLDILEARDRYLERSSSLIADGFVEAVVAAFRQISRRPGIGSVRIGQALNLPGLRAWRVARHPYLIYYLERESVVDVVRVLHERRDPQSALSVSVSALRPGR